MRHERRRTTRPCSLLSLPCCCACTTALSRPLTLIPRVQALAWRNAGTSKGARAARTHPAHGRNTTRQNSRSSKSAAPVPQRVRDPHTCEASGPLPPCKPRVPLALPAPASTCPTRWGVRNPPRPPHHQRSPDDLPPPSPTAHCRATPWLAAAILTATCRGARNTGTAAPEPTPPSTSSSRSSS